MLSVLRNRNAVIALAALSVSSLAYAHSIVESDTKVIWDAGPCSEPVLFVETDRENVRAHIPDGYPGSDDEFMSHLVPSVGADGTPKATVVFTLNRCKNSTVTSVVNGTARPSSSATNVAEILVMVLWDGASENAFEFYALASYINEPQLATALQSLGLPSKHVPQLTYQLDADPEEPAPGVEVPLLVDIPGSFRFEGTAVRPLAYGPAGHATHHYHGTRGEVWVEHDAPTGGVSTSSATITVTGDEGAWLASLLGTDRAVAHGLLLEKHVGHAHTAYLGH